MSWVKGRPSLDRSEKLTLEDIRMIEASKPKVEPNDFRVVFPVHVSSSAMRYETAWISLTKYYELRNAHGKNVSIIDKKKGAHL